MLGLTEAAERYDDTRSEPFLAFAEKRIRGAVLDELRRGDIMPRRVRQMARKVGADHPRARAAASAAAPEDEEVAEALGVSVEEYRDDLEQLVHVTVGALDRLEAARSPPTTTSPEASGRAPRGRWRRVRDALTDARPSATLLVLSLHYNEELTYGEIGAGPRRHRPRACASCTAARSRACAPSLLARAARGGHA